MANKFGGRTTLVEIIICTENVEENNTLSGMIKERYLNRVHITYCTNYFALRTHVVDELRGRVDIIFMDFNIAENSGVDAAYAIQKIYPNIQITFISDNAEDVTNIFKANPSYFLVRPVREDGICESMIRMMEHITLRKRKTLLIETKKGIYSLMIKNICYIESEKRLIKYHMDEQRCESGYGKLDEIQEKLPEQFIRCHQSYIVNIEKIQFLSGKEIILDDDTVIPVSRNKYKDTKDKILYYFSDQDRLLQPHMIIV